MILSLFDDGLHIESILLIFLNSVGGDWSSTLWGQKFMKRKNWKAKFKVSENKITKI